MNKSSKWLILGVMAVVLLWQSPISAANMCKQGNWIIGEDTDPMDDSKRVIMVLYSENKGTWGKPYTLVISCEHNRTELYITWNKYISDNSPKVTVRLDKKRAQTYSWSKSADETATFHKGVSTVDFIKQLMRSETLVARVIPYRRAPITAIFDVKGLS